MKKSILFFVFFMIVFSVFVQGVEYCDTGEICKSNESGTILSNNSEIHTHSEDAICIVYFYSESCPHCANTKPLIDSLEQKYNDSIRLTRYDVSNPENIQLYNKLCTLRGYDGKKIPLVGINDRILVGEDEIRDNLEAEIQRGIEMDEKICPLGGEMCHLINQTKNGGSDYLIPNLKSLNFFSVLPLIIIAGLGDGINPCAFIILIFVMVMLQSISGTKKRLLKVTLTYIISIFATNILLGILYFFLSINIGYPNLIRNSVIIISLVAGAINIKDFFYYGKGISLGIPKTTKKYLMGLINRASVPAALVLGVSVAILEAPCSIPIYLAVIEVLKAEGNTLAAVFPYILIYNLMFILPLIVLSLAVYFGYRADYFEKASLKSKRYMKLVIGIILIVLAIVLLLGWL